MYVREIEHKKSRIVDLENTVKMLSTEKDELFDQVQLRQAETESSQSHLESLQGQNTELQYQLREASDRIALLQDEFTDVRREHDMKVQSPGPLLKNSSGLDADRCRNLRLNSTSSPCIASPILNRRSNVPALFY